MNRASVPGNGFIRKRRPDCPTAKQRISCFIQRLNVAAFNVVEPAVQAQGMVAQADGHRRMGFDVVQLSDDVFLHHAVDLIGFAGPGFLFHHRFLQHQRSAASGDTAGIGSRHWQVAIAFIAPQLEWPQITISVTPSATTAYSMVAETPRLRPERRHDIPGITNDKELSRLLLGNQFRHQTAVRTGDEKRFGILAEAGLRKSSLRWGRSLSGS